jgi:hypothetical protein
MSRIPILAGGAVLASLVLCFGAVTVANAVSSTPGSQVLPIAGVSTTATATPSASATPSATPTAVAPLPSASATAEPSDPASGVTVVKPSDPTKIEAKATDGKGCAHLVKTSTPTSTPGTYPNWTATPVPQDPDHPVAPNAVGSWNGAWKYPGGTGGYGTPYDAGSGQH